jgi:probable phosphoglycerate mutase
MKTTIYLIRHAQSMANANNIMGANYELSPVGFIQAENLARRLKNYKIDKIYSSPLTRTIQTINPTAKMLRQPINLIDDLREIYIGSWENQNAKDLRAKYPETFKLIDETFYYNGIIGQEETSNVASRMHQTITKLAEANPDKNIIVVSHCIAIRAFLCQVLNIPFEQTREKIGYINNASITTLTFDIKTKQYEIIKINQ